MTKEDLEAALDRVRSWPEEMQRRAMDAIAAIELGGDEELYELSEEDLAAIDAGDASPDATEEEVRRVFRLDR